MSRVFSAWILLDEIFLWFKMVVRYKVELALVAGGASEQVGFGLSFCSEK